MAHYAFALHATTPCCGSEGFYFPPTPRPFNLEKVIGKTDWDSKNREIDAQLRKVSSLNGFFDWGKSQAAKKRRFQYFSSSMNEFFKERQYNDRDIIWEVRGYLNGPGREGLLLHVFNPEKKDPAPSDFAAGDDNCFRCTEILGFVNRDGDPSAHVTEAILAMNEPDVIIQIDQDDPRTDALLPFAQTVAPSAPPLPGPSEAPPAYEEDK
uniref:Uncharacterized protein n=1 Tax=Chromera velia CCMP2878 TaxID=1169474 RepID=A0A0G4HR23_9ALVE|eukprot:Cvel_30467.t1-p1 / transcript=Cvel_30467.t1 / gene=Cvel_30467 / organism=Chromera_velia_CCMP2878 / gene_product=hypothetical protein / transcript_product=hypothetical protein / location=Cvel_scaffold4346:5802-8413(-) / protein_length=209 / sequence_SO=supercontig / SO=protein_coding / is_pseudo=false